MLFIVCLVDAFACAVQMTDHNSEIALDYADVFRTAVERNQKLADKYGKVLTKECGSPRSPRAELFSDSLTEEDVREAELQLDIKVMKECSPIKPVEAEIQGPDTPVMSEKNLKASQSHKLLQPSERETI